jgi:hypothetical protein
MIDFCLFYRLRYRILNALLTALTVIAPTAQARASTPRRLAQIPVEITSSHFTVTVNGVSSLVIHAASGYYLLNFEISGPAQITVEAEDPHYWDSGVEVQPMRLGIRPHRDGASISFPIEGPAKLSIVRPNDHFADSEMLFLFANQPDASGIRSETPGIRYYGPGFHRENIDAHSGDRIYLAAGAVVFGSLNIWQVQDVHVSGLGTIVYDGPQNPDHDEGWIHKPNWHAIVMDNASDIHIEGITAIVRSRTWMVQMRDSHGIQFRNVKIIGGSPGNANQDGMDWLGGGDTLVQDCFIRAADDIFAMYGNWDGYSEEALTAPGHEVGNITIENSVLSTSISNVVRMGWPKKVFDSHGFTLRNSDVIHMGVGGCGVPFAVFELWADPGGKGRHSGILLDNIRLDEWYSLAQVRQPNPGIRGIKFSNIWAMDGPGLAPSVLKGDVAGIAFGGVNLGSGEVLKNSDLPIELTDGAEQPHYEGAVLDAGFAYSTGLIHPGSKVVFTAKNQPGLHYRWFFGDGDTAEGQVVSHRFPDAQGTLLDASGRFRVLLSVTGDAGHQSWSSQSIVVSASIKPAAHAHALLPRLAPIGGHPGSYDGFLRVPSGGGYTFTLLTSTAASLTIDGVSATNATLRPQVCGSTGNAVQAIRVSVALSRGLHRVRIERGPEIENAENPGLASDRPLLLWEGRALRRQFVPESAMSHAKFDRSF